MFYTQEHNSTPMKGRITLVYNSSKKSTKALQAYQSFGMSSSIRYRYS
ncbi:MAG: hypothetical protein IPP86_07050 [Bacteroidetes bacterium]|nr:hypothetical protein [Bacteroidota bacterium]